MSQPRGPPTHSQVFSDWTDWAATEKHEWETVFLCETLFIPPKKRKHPTFNVGPDLSPLKELKVR